MLTLTLAIGVAVNVALLELTALSAGGIIVPGYVAMILDRPRALAALALMVLGTWLVTRAVTNVLALYGVRRFGITMLVGLAFSTGAHLVRVDPDLAVLEWAGLGYIVPGLIAHHWERQGFWPTLLMIAIAAPITRLLSLVAVRWL